MIKTSSKLILFLTIWLAATACAAIAQDAGERFPGSRPTSDFPMGMKDMLAKQRAARNKKDFQEMQKRGEEALRLSEQLEASFEQNKSLSPEDRQKLEELERLVIKIREELGGDDVDESDGADGVKRPLSLQNAFKSLQETTVSLVDELKKTTRFTISAVAIQSSNSVLKIIHFLRLRK